MIRHKNTLWFGFSLLGLSRSNIATCGGNTICVIDCSTGKVIKKYQHDREKEVRLLLDQFELTKGEGNMA